MKPHYGPGYGLDIKPPTSMSNEVQPAWQGRSIAGPKIRMVEFSAFLEQQRDADSVSQVNSKQLLEHTISVKSNSGLKHIP